KFFFAGKEKQLALGVYPEVPLVDARKRCTEARKLLAAGRDPGEAKQEAKRLAAVKSGNTFEVVAREWYEKRTHEWAPGSLRCKRSYLDNYVLPKLGHRPISAITAPEVLAVLREIEARGTLDTARRVMQMCDQIFRYGIATGRAERSPVPDLRGALKTPVVKHQAFLKANELPEYLRRLDAYDGGLQTRLG